MNETEATPILKTHQRPPCKRCGQPVKNYDKTYCSQSCSSRGRSGPLNGNWKGGVAKDNVRYKNRFRARYPEKARAHDETKKALNRGDLVPAACEACGKPPTPKNTAAHHFDYSKPLDVTWLCRSCHLLLHRLMALAKRIESGAPGGERSLVSGVKGQRPRPLDDRGETEKRTKIGQRA